MKIAFVVLVPLFIGYNSGVIVPSGVSKRPINKTLLESSFNNSKKIFTNLEKSNNIDEKELFQSASDKESSLNERSFIIINQRFKTPLRNQHYNSQTHHLNKPFDISERLPQVKVIPQSSVNANVSPLVELFIPNKKNTVPLKYSYNAPKYNLVKGLNQYANYRYLLLKPEESKMKQSTAKPTSNDIFVTKNELYDQSTDTINVQSGKKNQHTISHTRHRVHYNYGFPAPSETHNSNFGTSVSSSSLENINLQKNLDLGENINPLNNNGDVDHDQLLERYIKETLNERGSNEIIDLKQKLEHCKLCASKENKPHTNDKLNCMCNGEVSNPIIKKPEITQFDEKKSDPKSLSFSEYDLL